MSGENQDVVQIEIGIEKLESLFNKGEVCATDFRCMNCESKKCIWNLCLTSCARRMQCDLVSFERHAFCKQTADNLLKESSIIVYVKQENLEKLA